MEELSGEREVHKREKKETMEERKKDKRPHGVNRLLQITNF
jgi:hypothetical protein